MDAGLPDTRLSVLTGQIFSFIKQIQEAWVHSVWPALLFLPGAETRSLDNSHIKKRVFVRAGYPRVRTRCCLELKLAHIRLFTSRQKPDAAFRPIGIFTPPSHVYTDALVMVAIVTARRGRKESPVPGGK